MFHNEQKTSVSVDQKPFNFEYPEKPFNFEYPEKPFNFEYPENQTRSFNFNYTEQKTSIKKEMPISDPNPIVSSKLNMKVRRNRMTVSIPTIRPFFEKGSLLTIKNIPMPTIIEV
jgi:hypothetical protein